MRMSDKRTLVEYEPMWKLNAFLNGVLVGVLVGMIGTYAGLAIGIYIKYH